MTDPAAEGTTPQQPGQDAPKIDRSTSSQSLEKTPGETLEERRSGDRRKRGKRDWLGSAIGLLVFLGGIALLVLVFRLAYQMFQTPPSVALSIERGQSLNLASASSRLTEIVLRVILLILMTLTGSVVANRGIHLYASSSGRRR